MSRLLPLLAADDPGFTPSNYQPAFRVEIAFGSGYTTPDADRVWTDVSDYVELAHGMGVTFGRQDERSTADTNDLTLVLDNSDGRFTAGRAASPYYPNVKVGRPIRLSLMTVTGYTSVRFVGFVNQWPVEWDGTDAYAKATVTATSRLSRLGLSAKLRSMPEAAILAASPHRYWTLGDPAGSLSAVESTGNAGPPLPVVGSTGWLPLVFGNATGPGTDGLSAVTFPSSDAEAEYLNGYAVDLPAGPRSLRCWFRVEALPTLALERTFASCGLLWFNLTNAGVLKGYGTTGPNINDGQGHDLVLVRDGTTELLYVDGALVASVASGTPAATTSVTAGGVAGTMAHLAVYDRALTAAEIAAQYDTMQTTFTERTDQRAARILGWAGVAASEISTQTGSETMTYQLTSGQSVVDALRDVESTEGGVLFDGRDGRVTFHNRSHRYTAPIAVTLDMAAQQVEADYAPKLDRSTLTNDVTVDNPTTGETARSVDAASVDEYGTATSSAKSVADSYDPLQQKAAWLVASYAEPRSRVPSLTVDVLAQVGGTPSAEDILALTVGSRIQVINQPAQADATTADYFVEGYTETIGPETYRITFNLSPAHPSLSVFVLDDPVRGKLDSGYVLGL
jgi:hypothetical protein